MKLVLGPPAFAGPGRMDAHVAGLVARGVEAVAVALPPGPAERAVPALAAYAGDGVIAGGQSFGGRVATLAALGGGFRAVVALAFPLAGRAEARTAHFESLRVPVLLVSGDRDHLAPLAELRAAAARLPQGRLVVIRGAGHSLAGHLDAVLDATAGFVLSLDPI